MWHVLLVFSTIITVNNLDFWCSPQGCVAWNWVMPCPPYGATYWCVHSNNLGIDCDPFLIFLSLTSWISCDAYFLVVFLPDVFLDFLKYKSRFSSSMESSISAPKGWGLVDLGVLLSFFFWLVFSLCRLPGLLDNATKQNFGISIFVCFILFLCTIGCFCSMYYSDRI